MKRDHVKKVAINMVVKSGLANLSRKDLCNAAGIPDGSFQHVMGCTFSEFVKELMQDKTVEKNDECKIVKTRIDPELRKDQILRQAVIIALKVGHDKVTREEIALQAGVSMGSVTRYFGTMKKLRRSIKRSINQTN